MRCISVPSTVAWEPSFGDQPPLAGHGWTLHEDGGGSARALRHFPTEAPRGGIMEKCQNVNMVNRATKIPPTPRRARGVPDPVPTLVQAPVAVAWVNRPPPSSAAPSVAHVKGWRPSSSIPPAANATPSCTRAPTAPTSIRPCLMNADDRTSPTCPARPRATVVPNSPPRRARSSLEKKRASRRIPRRPSTLYSTSESGLRGSMAACRYLQASDPFDVPGIVRLDLDL